MARSSPTQIGPWTLGKHLTLCQIASATIDSDNVWTVDTAGASELVAQIRRLNFQNRFTLKDIRPITNPQENMVVTSVGCSLQLTVIRVANNTTPGNAFSATVAVGQYVQVIFNDSHEQFDGFYIVANFETVR